MTRFNFDPFQPATTIGTDLYQQNGNVWLCRGPMNRSTSYWLVAEYPPAHLTADGKRKWSELRLVRQSN